MALITDHAVAFCRNFGFEILVQFVWHSLTLQPLQPTVLVG
jgi:hypothetical protein